MKTLRGGWCSHFIGEETEKLSICSRSQVVRGRAEIKTGQTQRSTFSQICRREETELNSSLYKKKIETHIYGTLVPNSNAEAFLSLSFGTTLPPGSGVQRRKQRMRKLSSSGLGRETDTTGFDRAYHRVAWEPRENRGLLLWGVPANYTEEAVLARGLRMAGLSGSPGNTEVEGLREAPA